MSTAGQPHRRRRRLSAALVCAGLVITMSTLGGRVGASLADPTGEPPHPNPTTENSVPTLTAAETDVFPQISQKDQAPERWVNANLRQEDLDSDLKVEVHAPEGGHVGEGRPLQLGVTITNEGSQRIEGVTVQARLATPTSTVRESRIALSMGLDSYAVSAAITPTPVNLDPHQDISFTQEFQTSPTPHTPGDSTLTMAPGTYPVAVSAAGSRVDGEAQQSSDRFLVTVGDPDPRDRLTPRTEGVGVTVLLPLSAPVPIVPGETGEAPEPAPLLLEDESLAAALAPEGRLTTLLDTYAAALAPETDARLRDATCLALDPALVEAVSRMATGYKIGDTRERFQASRTRLRDSWDMTPDTSTQPGTGSADAARWLERLRDIADGSCTVALPWANTSLDAVHRTANPWLMREAVERGPDVIREVIGVEVTPNVVIPGEGYVSDTAVPSLGWVDQNTGENTLEEAWEEQDAPDAATPEPAADEYGTPTLDDNELPRPGEGSPPPKPDEMISVLVSSNSVWGAPEAGRFAQLSERVRAVEYSDTVNATLAVTGTNPKTVGYSDPDLRYDPTLDSPAARDLTAAAVVTQGISESIAEFLASPAAQQDPASEPTSLGRPTARPDIETTEPTPRPEPLLLNPPSDLEAATAQSLLDAILRALRRGTAEPLRLEEYLRATPADEDALRRSIAAQDPARAGERRTGAPYLDATRVSKIEVLRATQQANFTDALTSLLRNDPAIALSRYEFTAPLRRDLLRALSITGRLSLVTFDDSVAECRRRLRQNRTMLHSLQSSVTVIPPGNTFTRVSDSSPLLIVATNGLPLAVDATIRYTSDQEEVVLDTPRTITIPARGSITVEMTTSMPQRQDPTKLQLWLATVSGSPISPPIELAVFTRAGVTTTATAVIAIVVALAAALTFEGKRRARRSVTRPSGTHRAGGIEET